MALSNLVRHFSNYSFGSLIVTLAGLVSFPLLTRLLGTEGYGQLSLITVTLIPLVAFGKCGLQHSTMVFYAETRNGQNAWHLDQYYPTLLYGMAASGLVVSLLWLGIILVVRGEWDRLEIVDLFALATPLIFVRVLHSGLLNILRARERSGAAALWQIAHRYTILAFVVAGLLLVEASVRTFVLASIVAESLILVSMAFYVLRGISLERPLFSLSLFRAMAIFGLPMLGFEIAGAAANIGDRYVIKLLLGADELGKYAAAYNLSEYVAGTLVLALATAVLPMYLRVWSEEGAEATRGFIADSMRLYLFAALPLAAGFSAVAESFIALMASEKYVEGADAIPLIIFGLIINGLVVMLAAGLYITKQSRKLMYVLGSAAILNVLMNLVLVPVMGITGAALATLVTYLLYALAAWRMADPYLHLAIPWRKSGVYALCALGMYLAVRFIRLDGLVATLLVQVVVGVGAYALLVFVMDPESRELFSRLRRRGKG